jgi:hypothetical protein
MGYGASKNFASPSVFSIDNNHGAVVVHCWSEGGVKKHYLSYDIKQDERVVATAHPLAVSAASGGSSATVGERQIGTDQTESALWYVRVSKIDFSVVEYSITVIHESSNCYTLGHYRE